MVGLGVILTVVVMLGVVAAILLFERQRAKGIDDDLRRMGEDRLHHDDEP